MAKSETHRKTNACGLWEPTELQYVTPTTGYCCRDWPPRVRLMLRSHCVIYLHIINRTRSQRSIKTDTVEVSAYTHQMVPNLTYTSLGCHASFTETSTDRMCCLLLQMLRRTEWLITHRWPSWDTEKKSGSAQHTTGLPTNVPGRPEKLVNTPCTITDVGYGFLDTGVTIH